MAPCKEEWGRPGLPNTEQSKNRAEQSRVDFRYILVSAPSYLSPAKIAQYFKGKSSYRLQREFPSLKKRYWGSHLWSRGYFCCTIGAVTEEM
ncbi:MAG: IS200/IS605 family transposase, partial [Holosporaceae bacterium]